MCVFEMVASPSGQRWRLPMKIMLRAAFAVVTIGVAAANGQTAHYHTPTQNYYQNSWMANSPAGLADQPQGASQPGQLRLDHRPQYTAGRQRNGLRGWRR